MRLDGHRVVASFCLFLLVITLGSVEVTATKGPLVIQWNGAALQTDRVYSRAVANSQIVGTCQGDRDRLLLVNGRNLEELDYNGRERYVARTVRDGRIEESYHIWLALDVNGDGEEDLIHATPTSDSLPRSEKDVNIEICGQWFVLAPHRADAMAIGDFDADGIPEIIMAVHRLSSKGVVQSVAISAYEWDGETFSEIWNSELPNCYIAQLTVGDADNDGKPELVAFATDWTHSLYQSKIKIWGVTGQSE